MTLTHTEALRTSSIGYIERFRGLEYSQILACRNLPMALAYHGDGFSLKEHIEYCRTFEWGAAHVAEYEAMCRLEYRPLWFELGVLLESLATYAMTNGRCDIIEKYAPAYPSRYWSTQLARHYTPALLPIVPLVLQGPVTLRAARRLLSDGLHRELFLYVVGRKGISLERLPTRYTTRETFQELRDLGADFSSPTYVWKALLKRWPLSVIAFLLECCTQIYLRMVTWQHDDMPDTIYKLLDARLQLWVLPENKAQLLARGLSEERYEWYLDKDSEDRPFPLVAGELYESVMSTEDGYLEAEELDVATRELHPFVHPVARPRPWTADGRSTEELVREALVFGGQAFARLEARIASRGENWTHYALLKAFIV